MAYTLTEVKTPEDARTFLHLPVDLYKNDPYWIRPLDKDVESVFDPDKNKFFRHGTCIRWLLYDNEEVIGRVAAFVDEKTARNNTQPTGGMGFFECINHQEAANKLFDACKNWLKEQGMEAMDGPINFGDRDRFWGLLIEGFMPQNYGVPYNFPYYRSLFEHYGFKNYFEQYTYYRPINAYGMDPSIRNKAERLAKNPEYKFRCISKKALDKYASDFRTVYNQAWTKHSGVKPISALHARALLISFKPILDKRLMWFAYHEGEPIGFFLMIPEINQWVKSLNGKMDLLAKIKFWLLKKFKPCTTAFGLIFGVVPAYQGKGVEGGMIIAFEKIALSRGFPYKDLEMNWIGDFNPSMMKLVAQVGARIIKTHVTYRLIFDPEKPFERAKKL